MNSHDFNGNQDAWVPKDMAQVVKGIGGGAWTRTTDLRIMRPSL